MQGKMHDSLEEHQEFFRSLRNACQGYPYPVLPQDTLRAAQARNGTVTASSKEETTNKLLLLEDV